MTKPSLLPRVILFCAASALAALAGCSSDDGAKKDDAANPTKEEPAAEEPAAEEPAAEEPAAEAGPDLSVFQGAARVTPATAKSGAAGVRLGAVTADGGYAACGLADGDIVTKIDGADVPAGKPGVDALIDACANKKAIEVERGDETMTLGGGA